MRGAARAERAREKCEARVARPSVRPARALDINELHSLRAGAALMREKDQSAWHRVRRMGFRVTHDPVEFVRLVVQARQVPPKGNLLLALVSVFV